MMKLPIGHKLVGSFFFSFLAGCASLPEKESLTVPAEICKEGKKQEKIAAIEIRYSWFPPIECPRLTAELGMSAVDILLMGAAIPIACAFIKDVSAVERVAIVVLPVGAPDWLRDHEIDHVKGMVHPFFLSFLPSWECSPK